MDFQHLWRDPIMLLLFGGSVLSWVLIVERIIALQMSKRADRAFVPGMVDDASPLANFHAEVARHAGAGREYVATILDTAITRQRQRLEGTLPIIGIIGNVAPYFGLLGTVVGIIQAFTAIETANDMSPTIVAAGIATALFTTVAGLVVAIPAVTAHHLMMVAISRRVAEWESTVAIWLPDSTTEEARHELIAHR